MDIRTTTLPRPLGPRPQPVAPGPINESLTAERPRYFGGPDRPIPPIGRFPFRRLVEEWLRQREEGTGAAPMAMYGPLQLTNGAITLAELVQAARMCELEADPHDPLDGCMRPSEFVEWLAYVISPPGRPRP